MGVQLRKVRSGLENCVIHKDFYERGRYVAHNCDVRYSPTHSELLCRTIDTIVSWSDCTETLPRYRYQATASHRTSVASSG